MKALAIVRVTFPINILIETEEKNIGCCSSMMWVTLRHKSPLSLPSLLLFLNIYTEKFTLLTNLYPEDAGIMCLHEFSIVTHIRVV